MSDYPRCPLCGNVNPYDLGPVTGMCLDGRACRRRQAGVEPVNPDHDVLMVCAACHREVGLYETGYWHHLTWNRCSAAPIEAVPDA